MTQMSNRRVVPVVVILLIGVVCAEDRVQSELRFAAHSKDEKTAGVWVDGQYVGFVKELAGDKKLTLLPGKHEIVIRQAWYNEFVKQIILEPGQTHEVNVELVKSARLPTKDATGELKIAATPSRAAVFVDGQYAGCLSKGDSAKEFLLTGNDGSTWEVRSSNVALAEHVGHTVTATGVVSNATGHNLKEDAKDAAKDSGMTKTNAEHGHLTVTKVEMVSDSCK